MHFFFIYKRKLVSIGLVRKKLKRIEVLLYWAVITFRLYPLLYVHLEKSDLKILLAKENQ